MSAFVKRFINRFQSFVQDNRWFILLLTAGLIFRIAFIFFHGLSNDELSAWHRAVNISWNELWYKGIQTGDMHPGLYQVFLWFWIQIFGDSEWSIRFPSLLFFIANVSLIYLIGKKFFSQSGTWLYLIVYSFLFFPIMHTVFARPYNSGTFFILILVYQSLQFRVQEKPFAWRNVWIVIGFLGAMLSHYFAFLVAGIFGVTFIILLPRKKWLTWIGIGLTAALCFLPHFQVTWHHLHAGGLGWVAKPEINWFAAFFFQFFNEDWFLVSILSIITLTGFFTQKGSVETRFFLFLSLFIGISTFLISIYFTPITRDVAMLFVLPFFFWGISPYFNRTPLQTTLAGLLFCFYLVGSTLFVKDFSKPVHFGVFRELGNEAKNIFQSIPPDSIEIISSSMNIDYLNFYYPIRLNEAITSWGTTENVREIEERITSSNKPYVLFQWTNSFFLPQFLEVIRSHYPTIENGNMYFNSGFYLFSKNKKSADPLLVKKRILPENTFPKQVNSSEEFIGHIYISLSKKSAKAAYFLIECQVDSTKMTDLNLVAVLERDGKMVQRENGDPFYYMAQNMNQLKNKQNKGFLACPIPENYESNDRLHVYIWNPSKQEVYFEKPVVYEVFE